MFNLFQLRKRALAKAEPVKADDTKLKNLQATKVYAYVDGKLVGDYDSITKCGTALGMSRPAVKKAIESGTVLDNGFVLKFN